MSLDAIIIGGGPAGATVATLLAKAGWSVAVVEKSRYPRQKVCGEFLSATNHPLLRTLGAGNTFSKLAGPDITSVGLFARETISTSPMPQANGEAWGHALGRDQLDALLLGLAAEAGANVWQPWSATELDRNEDGFSCRIVERDTQQNRELRARVVIAAHGSWEHGRLPTQSRHYPTKPSDLFGFKARFRDLRLAEGTMPLLVFPGGYGGMVHSDHGRVSLSCCVRRDRLETVRKQHPAASAGQAVLAHIKTSCRGAREALADASLDGAWLSVGPIRPGIRTPYCDGVFFVGNAAGEAHPIIAEGISMAMQAAWLLSGQLAGHGNKNLTATSLDRIGHEYLTLWRRSFATRIRAAACFAHLAMRPATANALLPLIQLFPRILTLGARWSGKATDLFPPALAHNPA